jgi:transposase InsO family protein
MQKVTAYSRQQLTRLIAQFRLRRCIQTRYARCHRFTQKYSREDTLLLAKTDECHDQLSGAITKKLFERAYLVFKDPAYKALSQISVAHIYNLRASNTYRHTRTFYSKTNPTSIKIGMRTKPCPNNQPGYLRVDTVHQGDRDKQKGVYHINAVDEVTQFEIVSSVERISEQFLLPILEAMLRSYPFIIINFHADNGTEYINHMVVNMLNKLNVSLTKSRANHSNDNALAESKNGSIIRKHLGYIHIPQKWASDMNEFNQTYLNPYINFHRPCYFPETIVNAKGKHKKIYPYTAMMTPYEKLKSLPSAEQYLKPGINFELLDQQALCYTDLESAAQMREARKQLYRNIFAD